MAELTYTSLKEPLTENLLLELAPGRGRLQGRLRTHDLKSSEGTYMILSYSKVAGGGGRKHDLVITIVKEGARESGDDQCRGGGNHCPARFRPSTRVMGEEVEASRAYTL